MSIAVPPTARAVRRALLGWYARNARELPWRSRRDPWRVWVAEVMLQQTRVEAVIEPYRRFIARFPSLASLARAHEDEVLAQWSGLGYYRRARLLHAGARHVAEHCGGRIPRSRGELERVPGVGDYTAGALLSIAFGQREPALDANVARVVARLCGIRGPLAARGREAARRFAGALVDCERPGDVNEALMDLGASVCTARSARCGACPLAGACAALRSGDPLAFGTRPPRPAPRAVEVVCGVLRDSRGRVLLLRRARDEALLAGLWDLPGFESGPGANGDAGPGGDELRLAGIVRSATGIEARFGAPLLTLRHEIVGRRIRATVHAASCRGAAKLPALARFVAEEELSSLGVPALPVKIFRALALRDRPQEFLRPGRAARGAA